MLDDDPPSVDSLELRHQQRDLLRIMFGAEEESEPPRFGHYVILHKLGRGGMGVVYAARDPKLDRNVAIKKLHGRGDPRLQQRLVREAQVMARLAHPNVVMVHEIGEAEGATFIVMEYIEGVTLRQWLKQELRSCSEILTMFKAAAEGLIAAHQRGVVHRDFKPDNVMLGNDGRVRVMDFGLARTDLHGEEIGGADSDPAESVSRLTRSGALLGTIPYMAPEQLRGQQADAVSDQFGFCVALYEALYGQRPFAGKTHEQRLAAIERGEIYEPPKNSVVPRRLRQTVIRGLDPRPEDRFESMQALLGELVASETAEDTREPPEYVFVAHDSVDKQVVRRLCEELLDRGVRPWLDIWDLRPDFAWRPQMQEALRKAPTVLVCHGPGGWHERDPELAEVLRSRIEANPTSVYRVGLPGAIPGPLPISEISEGVDLDDNGWEDGIVELVQLIGADRERRDWLGYEAKRVGFLRKGLCPYRGLEAFKESDARWMFGRDEETGELLELIRTGTARFLTVIGASGSGKSSLVMAGVCPALRNGVLGDRRVWEIGYLRPGARPCEALAHALVKLQTDRSLSAKELRDGLLTNDDRLRSVVNRMPGRKILLVVDQLEELFTEADLGSGTESSEAMAFARNIVEATRPDEALWVVSTLRADFVQRCLEIGVLARALKSGTYMALPPMGEQQIRAAVELPAKRVGFNVDARLVEKLVVGVAEQAGRLPLLQHVLRELWQRRDEHERVLEYDTYEETGGLERAIAVAAERALDGLRRELGTQADVVTRRVITRLVHLGKGASGDTRRRASLGRREVDSATRRVLDVLVGEARVLVASEKEGVEVFELAHEALLREWTTLVDWLDADRAALRVRQELAKDAAERGGRSAREYLWGKGRIEEAKRILAESTVELGDAERAFLDESDRHARRRTRLARGSVVAFMVVAAAVVVFVLRKNNELALARDRAEEQTRRANEQARRAEEQTSLAQARLAQAVRLARAIIYEVLPKLERYPQVRAERKEILQRLQEMLRELGVTDRDTAALHETMAVHQRRGDEALHTDNLEVARQEYTAALSIAEVLAQTQPSGQAHNRSVLHNRLGDLEMTAGDLAAARDHYERALVIDEALAKADPHSAQVQRDLSISHANIGDLEVTTGNLAAARDHYERALVIRESLAKADPHNVQAQRDLSASHQGLGDLEMTAGDLAAARDHYERTHVIFEALAEADLHSAQAQRDLAVAHEKLGNLEVAAGNLAAARDHYERSLVINEALAKADPHSAQAQSDLAGAHARVGDLEMTAGDLAAAREHYERALVILEALAKADPHNAEAQRNLSGSHGKLGELEVTAGNLAAAREHYERTHVIFEALAEADLHSAQAQRDLAVSHEKLGNLEVAAGNLAAAREHYERTHVIFEALAKADPHNAEAQRGLAVAHETLGNLEVTAGDLAATREHYERAFAIREALAKTDPHSAQAQRDLSISHANIGDLEVTAGDLAAAREHYERAVVILEALAKTDPHSAQAQRDLSILHGDVGDLEATAGDLAAAREHYERALVILKALAKADPHSAQAQRDLSVSHARVGDLEVIAGDLVAAREHYEHALVIDEALAKADPHSARNQRNLSVSHANVGDLEETAGDLAAAREHYERALVIREALAKADPHSAQAQHELAAAHNDLGNIEMTAGDLAAAREHYERCLAIAEVLAKANPESAAAQFTVASIFFNFAILAHKENSTTLVIEFGERAQAILEDMDAKGQIEGYQERERIYDAVKLALAQTQRSLKPTRPLAGLFRYTGKIIGPEAFAGLELGERCEIWIEPNDGRLNCRWHIDCGKPKRRIYGGGEVGYSTCEVDDHGHPLRAQDEDDDAQDGAFSADFTTNPKTITFEDRWIEPPVRVIISIDEGGPHGGDIPKVKQAPRDSPEKIQQRIEAGESPVIEAGVIGDW
jgi:serine/threonine protein kinase/tetratricopeptide (TPR) repeat protein